MIEQIIALAAGTLASEDLTCIAAGALVAEHKLDLLSAILACFAGIFTGDIALLAVGRWIGRPALRLPILRRMAPGLISQASDWFERRGGLVILLTRFSPGLRLPVYFAAGLTRMSIANAVAWFTVAAAVWTPLLVGAVAILGIPFAHRVPLLGLAAATIYFCLRLRDRVFRRRMHAFFARKIRWEFWPPWAAYLPLIPYLLYLSFKYRCVTLFTAANPGIRSGGLGGESKWETLRHLSKFGAFVAKSDLLTPGMRVRSFPVVLKPDVGERGRGVAIIRSQADLQSYAESAQGAVIVQEYVDGVEFGVFYCRYPNEESGRITSITEKRLPVAVGDGRTSLEELILNDARAFCIAKTYLKNVHRDPHSIPLAGECIHLAEIGSHCRGAVFIDATHLNTHALERSIDLVAKMHPGFFFGRFDLRAESVEAFQHGRFKVLELNGVGAEATHIYDPRIGIKEAYRVMRSQWRSAFEIGAANRARGTSPMTLRELTRHLLHPGVPAFTVTGPDHHR